MRKNIGKKLIALVLMAVMLISAAMPTSAAASDAANLGKLADSYTEIGRAHV